MKDLSELTTSDGEVGDDSLPPKLMKPWAAIELLELCVGGSVTAKEVIADKMRDGVLKAYAKTTSVSREKKLKLAWANVPAFDGTMKIIPKTKFIGSAHWAEDAHNWKWRTGNFHIQKRDGGFLLLKGVRLAENDVVQLVKRYDERIKNLHKGGRKLNEDAWYNMWLTLLWMQEKGQLDKSTIRAKKSFPSLVQETWKKNVLPELTAKYEDQIGSIVFDSRLKELPSVHTMRPSLVKLWGDLIA